LVRYERVTVMVIGNMKSYVAEHLNLGAVLAVDKRERCAGGKHAFFKVMFNDAEMIGFWHEPGYQGEEVVAYRFPNGIIAIVTSYFGSCSGCDAFEDADDVDVLTTFKSISNSARVFETLDEAKARIEEIRRQAESDEGVTQENYPLRLAGNLKL